MADDVMPWDVKYKPSPVKKSAPPPAAAPAADVAPAAEASAVATPTITDSTGFDAEFEKNRKRMQEQNQTNKTEQIQAAPLIQNTDWWLSPSALVGAGTLGGAALMYGGSKAIPIVKRWLSSGQSAPQGFVPSNVDVDPALGNLNNLNAPAATPAATITPAATPAGEFEPPMSRTAAPSQNLTIQEAQARMAGVTPAVTPVTPFVAPGAAPVVPEAAVPAMVEAPKPVVPSAAPNSVATKAVTDTIQQLGQEESAVAGAAMPSRPVTPTPTGELRTGAGLPAYAGEGKQYQRMPKEFASVKDVPAGYAFVPGVGPGTNTIRNLETPEGYKAAVQLHGGPFGSHDEAVAFMNKYNAEQRMGPPATRELRKSLGLPLQENTKGIPMKIAKVGGVVGAIMALPELANAGQSATQGKYGEAVGQTLGVASSFISPVAQFLAHIGNAGESPEEQARFERQRNYALRAGRGVAQGYDPRRLIGVAPPTR